MQSRLLSVSGSLRNNLCESRNRGAQVRERIYSLWKGLYKSSQEASPNSALFSSFLPPLPILILSFPLPPLFLSLSLSLSLHSALRLLRGVLDVQQSLNEANAAAGQASPDRAERRPIRGRRHSRSCEQMNGPVANGKMEMRKPFSARLFSYSRLVLSDHPLCDSYCITKPFSQG